MKRDLFLCIAVLVLLGFSLDVSASGPVRVEVLAMNHPPMQPVIRQLKDLFSKYGEKIAVSWYDVDTREGQQLMAIKGLTGHVPLVIWIQGSNTAKTGQKSVTFAGFPSGSGPEPFEGEWTMRDLSSALDQTISSRR